MNQYRCDETCNKKGTERCPIEFSTVEREAERVSETCGLVCHSDFQSERDKVLDDVIKIIHKKVSFPTNSGEQISCDASIRLGIIHDINTELRQ
jgi:hypothetical protein